MADIDILDLDEAKAAVSISDSSPNHEPTLRAWVTAISQRIDDLCGPVVYRTVTDEWHDGYTGALYLKQWPVASVSTITEYASGTPTPLVLDTIPDELDEPLTFAQYGYSLDNGIVTRRSSGSVGYFGERVRVTYVAGRFPTTADVDQKFKAAAGSILRRLWAREAGAWARGGDPFAAEGSGIGFFKAVEPMIEEFLGSEMKPPVIA